jgi:hypothetical protein
MGLIQTQPCVTCRQPARVQSRCVWCHNLHAQLADSQDARVAQSVLELFSLAHFFGVHRAFTSVVYRVVSTHIRAFAFEPDLFQRGWMKPQSGSPWASEHERVIFFPAGLQYLEGKTERGDIEVYVPEEIAKILEAASNTFLANPSKAGFDQFLQDCHHVWTKQDDWIRLFDEQKRHVALHGLK